jgi:hypothetical protein
MPGRVDGVRHAERVNAAVELLGAGVPVAQAARMLAARFGVSARQARRYLDQAGVSGPVTAPEELVVFTVKLPAGLAERVRGYARDRGLTISAVVAAAVREFLSRAGRSGRRAVEGRFVFDRHVDVDLSVAYGILVPAHRARMSVADQEGAARGDDDGDLRPGVLGPAEEGRDDRLADRGPARLCCAEPA